MPMRRFKEKKTFSMEILLRRRASLSGVAAVARVGSTAGLRVIHTSFVIRETIPGDRFLTTLLVTSPPHPLLLFSHNFGSFLKTWPRARWFQE